MNRFFVLHTDKSNLVAGWQYLRTQEPELVAALARGDSPARCLKTWHPVGHGRGDYIFSLWEADKAADVETALRSTRLPEYVVSDVLPIEEIDWVQPAESLT